MANIAETLISDYMKRRASESKQGTMDMLGSLGSTAAPTNYSVNANNFIGGFNQGMSNLIKFAQTGDRRRAEAAEHARMDEQTAYNRERQAALDAIAARTSDLKRFEFDYMKDRDLKADNEKKEADKEKKEQLQTQNELLALHDRVLNIGTAAKQEGAGSLNFLQNSGVPLQVGKDGKFSAVGMELAGDQLTALNNLNRSLMNDPTEKMVAELTTYANRVNNDDRDDNNVSLHSLMDQFLGKGATKLDSLNPVAAKRLEQQNQQIKAEYENEVSKIYSTYGIREGTLSKSIVDGASDWTGTTEFDEDYVKKGISENLDLEDLKDVQDEIFEEGGHKENILKDPLIKDAMKNGILNDSLINKALGDVARNAETTWGGWGLADRDLADSRYKRQVINTLHEAIIGIQAKDAVKAAELDSITKSDTAKTIATILNR